MAGQGGRRAAPKGNAQEGASSGRLVPAAEAVVASSEQQQAGERGGRGQWPWLWRQTPLAHWASGG